MSWNAKFIESLDKPSKIIEYALVFLPGGPNSVLFNGSLINNDPSQKVFLSEAYVTIDNVQITPSRWSVNFGGFTIEIVGDIRPLKQTEFQKGALAELHMRRDRQFVERVAIGQLRSVSGGRGKWKLQFGDLLSAMVNRFVSSTNELNYYNNVGSETRVQATFSFSSSANLYVDDVTIFEKETGGSGIIKVEKSSSGLTGYYLWSSKTVTASPVGYLTISDTQAWPSKTNILSLAIGDKITHLARLHGRPDSIFIRTLMSSGSGTQGSFDTYPESWGTGWKFSPNLIDFSSLLVWYSVWNITNDYEFQLVVESQESSGIRFLLSKFLNVGMWPVFRQNAISWRVCQDPNNAVAKSISMNIYDSDIINVIDHQIYSPSASNSYRQSAIKTIDLSLNDLTVIINQTVVYSLPIEEQILRDNQFIYAKDGATPQSQANADLKRLKYWDFYPWEELVITVVEKFAALVAGDIIQITSNDLYGYSEAEGKTYQARRGMILGVRWQPNQSQCILRIGIVRTKN